MGAAEPRAAGARRTGRRREGVDVIFAAAEIFLDARDVTGGSREVDARFLGAGRRRSNRLGLRTSWSSQAAASPAWRSRRRPGGRGVAPEVIVMERDASAEARRQGYGVTLSETNAALAGLGILEDLRAGNTRSCAHWTFKDDGAVLGYFGLAFLPEGREAASGVTNLRVPAPRPRDHCGGCSPGRCGSGAESSITKRSRTTTRAPVSPW